MFLFLVAALVVVIAAVTFAVVGGADSGALRDEPSQFYADPLPPERPLEPTDLEALRLPLAVRGYRMAEVDDALDRLAAELAERDARIGELEAALTAAHAQPGPQPPERGPETGYGPHGDHGYGYGTGEDFR